MKKKNTVKIAAPTIEREGNEFALALERHWESLNVVINSAPESVKTADDGMMGLQMVHRNAQLIGKKLSAITQVLTAADDCGDGLKLTTAMYMLQCYLSSLPGELGQLRDDALRCIPQGLFPCGPRFMGQRISFQKSKHTFPLTTNLETEKDEPSSDD